MSTPSTAAETRQFIAELEEAIRPVLEKWGVEHKVGGAKYGHGEVKVPFTFAENAGRIGNYQDDWLLTSYGITAPVGTEFTSKGNRFRFDGVVPNRPKFPISATNLADGRGYKFTRHVVDKINAAAPVKEGSDGIVDS